MVSVFTVSARSHEHRCAVPGRAAGGTTRTVAATEHGISAALRTRLAHVVIAVVIGIASGCGVSAASASPSSHLWLTRFKAAPAPAGWLLLVPPSGTSSLWYPPIMRPIKGDLDSVSAALRERTGTILVYLNGVPKTGQPQMSAWPSFRLDHLRRTGIAWRTKRHTHPPWRFGAGEGRA